MFRRTSPQAPLFGVDTQLDPVKRARLKRLWAHQYRLHALPLIDEEKFAKYFHADNGRPNKPVRLVMSVLVLKEIFDLTDNDALEQLEWNTAWHYALDILPEEAHTCQKTLHNFRKHLLDDDEGVGVFESTTARLIEAAKVGTRKQRQDSTHIVSNIKLLTRLGLFVNTITPFLKALRQEHPRLYGKVAEDLCCRYLDREGYFADARSSEAKRRLSEAALDSWWLVKEFEGKRQVAAMPSFGLLARLYAEQCVEPEGAWVDKIELNKHPGTSSLQSPADPDVTYGHKGKGYEVQLVETCEEDNDFQVVTSVQVHGANESDQHQVEPGLEQTERTCGATPDELYADAGYASGNNILRAREAGTDLQAPIGSRESDKHLPIGEFTFDAAGERLLACPGDKAPDWCQPTRQGKSIQASFALKKCRRCPLREQCPTEHRKGRRVLNFVPGDVAVARRRKEQQTSEFKERYKIRSGIEATNSELKRRHGLAKPRVRGKPRVNLAVHLKVLGLNIKRYVASLTEACLEVSGPAPACVC